jgi:hypothetical protein
MLLGHSDERPDQLTDSTPKHSRFHTPEDAGMPPSLFAPPRINDLEIITIVGHHDSSLLGGVKELLVVRYSQVVPSNLMDRNGINAASSQPDGNRVSDIFIG